MIQSWEALHGKTSNLTENDHEKEVSEDHQSNQRFSIAGEVVCSSENDDICNHDGYSIDQVTNCPEPDVLSITLVAVIWLDQSRNAEHIDDKSMEECVKQPLREDVYTEALALHTYLV